MLKREHSAILSTFIKLPVVIKNFCFCLFLSGRFTQVLLCAYDDFRKSRLGENISNDHERQSKLQMHLVVSENQRRQK